MSYLHSAFMGWLGVGLLMLLCSHSALAQPAAHVDFDYGSAKFLVTTLDDDFCGAVPNPSSMTLLSVSDWNKLINHDCDQQQFGGYVLLSVVGSFIFVVLALFFFVLVFPCACLLRYRLGFFGGGRPSPISGLRGILIPNNDVDGHPGYSNLSIRSTKVAFGFLFVVVLVGGVIVVAGGAMVSHFIWQAQAIFESYPDYHLATTASVGQSLLNLPYTQDGSSAYAIQESYNTAKQFKKHGQDEIIDKLDTLDDVVQAAFYILVIIVFFFMLLAIYAALFKVGRLAIIIALLFTLLFAAVWAEFSFVYGASNIIDNMCGAIDRCHFCYTGQYPSDNNGNNYQCGKQFCSTPWFKAMQNCQNTTQYMYYGLEATINHGIDKAINATCTYVNSVCASAEVASCLYPNGPCNSTGLLGVGLAGIVSVGVKEGGNSTGVRYESVALLADDETVSAGLRAAASAAVANASYITQYEQLLQQAESLNCNSQYAFIESVPDGTYNRLQTHLCPASPDDDIYHQRPLQHILWIVAVGLMLMGVAIPFVQIVLCLGEKRWAKKAKKRSGGIDEDDSLVGLINTGWNAK